MTLTRHSLNNPAAVAVIAAIILFLGAISLFRLPVQLLPQIDKPAISIQTSWRSAAPQEIDSEINEPLEEVLQGMPGLDRLEAWANPGSSIINLTFALGSNMNQAMLEVISRMNRLRPLPVDAERPLILLGGFTSDAESLIWYFVQTLPGNDRPISSYRRFLDDRVINPLRSIKGVAGVNLSTTAGEEELQIIFDPHKAADYGIDLAAIVQQGGVSNNISGGFADVGRRQYSLRFRGKYTPENLITTVLDWRDGKPVTLGDIAEVKLGNGRRFSVAYQNGHPSAAIQLLKSNDTNVMAVIGEIKALVKSLNEGPLAAAGLRMEKSFDPSVFIERSVSLLVSNLALGVLLAVGVLWWFLRQVRATLLIASAIPISIAATFIVLDLAGRSVNVISLAGLAFAVGMVLDAAIVVLENIVRLRQSGEPSDEASEKGTSLIWGALLASTMTTVAIFIPVMFIEDVEGQLFADLALTIAIGIIVSMFVAITILPTAAKHWLHSVNIVDASKSRWKKIARLVMGLTANPVSRTVWVVLLIGGSLALSVALLPKQNYLPPLKRDAIDTRFFLPSGASIESIDTEILSEIIDRVEEYKAAGREPEILNYYIVVLGDLGFNQFAVRIKDQSRIDEMAEIVRNEFVTNFPDLQSNTERKDVFDSVEVSGSVEINIQSNNVEALRLAALETVRSLRARFPNANVTPQPDPAAIAPELRLDPNDARIAEVGWTRRQMGAIIQALGDGYWLGEYFDGEERLDVVFKARPWDTPEELSGMPLATPSGQVVTLANLVEIRRDTGTPQILRFDGRRTIRLTFTPPEGMALEDALAILKTEIVPPLLNILPDDGAVRIGGSADSMERAMGTLGLNFLLALVLLFLIMSALFRSLKDSFIVVVSIPLATVGGVVALSLLNQFVFQPLDILTMIGFIILLGLVVNNAILLVVEARRGEGQGLSRDAAIERALELRLRPIFMSTLTSLMGMLPLLVFPGEGSAMYRGMAAAIVGGMTVSTLFTLVLLPALLRIGGESQNLIASAIESKNFVPSDGAAE